MTVKELREILEKIEKEGNGDFSVTGDDMDEISYVKRDYSGVITAENEIWLTAQE